MCTIKKDLQHAARDLVKIKVLLSDWKQNNKGEMLNAVFRRRRRDGQGAAITGARSLRNCLCLNLFFQFNRKSQV